jgi:hypothetical protein
MIKMFIGSKENPCHSCRVGYHAECMEVWHYEDMDCCCGGEIAFDSAGNVRVEETTGDIIDGKDVDGGYLGNAHAGTKSLGDYKDPVSTGRKLAAQAAPIDAGLVCEWAGLARAGGGVFPIVGCIGRAASDRHHGPDKNTMNNAVGTNLHRICDHCHNTWHALNDPAYGERPDQSKPFIPQGEFGVDWFAHDAVSKATTEQIIEAETKRLNS